MWSVIIGGELRCAISGGRGCMLDRDNGHCHLGLIVNCIRLRRLLLLLYSDLQLNSSFILCAKLYP